MAEEDNQANVPAMYANGFNLAIGAADVVVTLLLNNRIVSELHLSYTLAKTLAKSIGDGVEQLEKLTGHDIMTTNEVAEKIQEHTGENNG